LRGVSAASRGPSVLAALRRASSSINASDRSGPRREITALPPSSNLPVPPLPVDPIREPRTALSNRRVPALAGRQGEEDCRPQGGNGNESGDATPRTNHPGDHGTSVARRPLDGELDAGQPVLRFSLLAGAKSMRARNARSAADGSRDRPSGLNSGRTPTKLDFAVIPREGSGYAEREHRQSARKAR
jgi:hypothetical protein